MIYKNKHYYKYDAIGPFGLTYLNELDHKAIGTPHRMIECYCHCSNVFPVRISYVVSGRQKSCGCLNNFSNGKNPNKKRSSPNKLTPSRPMPPVDCPWFKLSINPIII